MLVKKLVEALQEALQSELGPKASVYLYYDDQIYSLEIQINAKGRLGPGSVLLKLQPLDE